MKITTHPKLKDIDANRAWFIVDAEGQVLGKLATRIADILRGKHKVIWHPMHDCGDYVVVINAEKIVLTGNKEELKEYIHHTKHPGGIKRKTAGKMRKEHPERMLQAAVTGMIPANRIKRHIVAKLKVYAGTNHPHTAQNPKPLI
jgi:large subunit ribosomal protein L13